MSKAIPDKRTREIEKKLDDGCFPLSAIPELLAEREGLKGEIERLEGVIARLQFFAIDVQNWREGCWDYDDDVGHDRRDFSDDEEWDRLSEQAGRVLDAGKGE